MTNVEFSADDKTKTYILSLFHKEVATDGKVVDAKTKEPVLSVDGRQVTLENFGAVEMVDQKPIFVLNDIISILEFQMKYADKTDPQ
jgi:hypothetical protein